MSDEHDTGESFGLDTETTPMVRRPVKSRARLVVAHSPDEKVEGRWQFLGRVALAIGRSPSGDNKLLVEDGEISRTHAVIGKGEDGTWRVVDEDSRNGTMVNGERVAERALEDGAVIRVGSTLLVFQLVKVRPNERLEPERPPLLGPSIAMQRVRGEVSLAGKKSLPVLLLGESGAGKDVAARAIHLASDRPGPYVPVNCGGLPDNLVESELFGHSANAFTGAGEGKKGLLEVADGGTLFLDEIGEMPMPAQAKLLRAVDKRELRRVGETEVNTVDVRFIAATNRDLTSAIAQERFRGDLYARLRGLVVTIPPLRDRKDDVMPLVRHFLQREAPGLRVTPDAAEALLLYRWPYNVRELERVLTTASLRADGAEVVDIDNLPEEIACVLDDRLAEESEPPTGEMPAAVLVPTDVAPNATDLRRVLASFGGNVSQVAEFFGKDRRQIYRWAQRLGVDLDDYRSSE